MRKINLIRVHGEDLRFGVTTLDLQGEQHFLALAAKCAVAAIQEQIPGKLHRDGACAGSDAPMNHIADHRSGDARKINAPMLFKVLIFDGSNGVEENFRALLIRHENAALQSKAPDELPIVCVNFRDDIGPIGFERVNFRQVACIDKEQPGSGAEQNRAKQKKRQRNAVNQFPAAQTKGDRGKAQHEIRILAQLKPRRQADTQHRFQI